MLKKDNNAGFREVGPFSDKPRREFFEAGDVAREISVEQHESIFKTQKATPVVVGRYNSKTWCLKCSSDELRQDYVWLSCLVILGI